MSDEIQSFIEEISEERPKNPPRRRRSSSLGSRKPNNIHRPNENPKNLQKYASSGNLFDTSSNAGESDSSVYSIRVKNRLNSDNEGLENLFVNWSKDPKSIKNCLSRLQENNVFKTGFPLLDNINLEEYYPPVMFLISGALKIDNDYEIYTINNYDVRVSEFMSWAADNKKDLYDDYHKGLKAINQKVVDIANTEYDQGGNDKISEDETSIRRHSEIIGLMIVNKNQQVPSYLPNKSILSYDVVTKVGDVYIIDQNRKSDKSLRHIIMSNDLLSIFATKRAERLKYKFVMRHLYCGTCSDHQIPNIDSSLRIGGPFGDDIILTFSNPNSRNQWKSAIQSSISAALESLKTRVTEITILKNLETIPSAPLVSKLFSINGQTTGLDLKKKAIEGFNQNEKNITDYILTFNVKGTSREYVLHDDVLVMVLQEHIGCSGDSNSCTDSCLGVGNSSVLNRPNFYLQYNPLRDSVKTKKPKQTLDAKPTKSKQYSLNDKWIDNTVPNWLMMLLSDIYHEGSQTEGIFRLSGVCSKSDDLIQMICENGDEIEINEEIHTKANILKKFINAIEGSLFTYANKDKLIALSNEITSLEDFKRNEEQIHKVLNIVQSLPQNNYNFLQMFLVVIYHVDKNNEINKMTLTNLSVCLAPSVLTKMSETSHEDFLRTRRLFDCIISLYDKIVVEPVQRKIVTSFKTRNASDQSNGIMPRANENSFNANSESLLNSSCSNVFNDNETVREYQPSVPPRRKKKEFESPNDLDSPRSNLGRSRYINKRQSLIQMHGSASEELGTERLDGGFVLSNAKTDPGNTSTDETVRMNPRRRKKNREHHTVAITDNQSSSGTRTPDALQSSPFRRQNQVNRNRHRDSSASNIKVLEDEIKSAGFIEDFDDVGAKPELLKRNDRVLLDQTTRSRERTRQYKPVQNNSKDISRFTFHSNTQSKEVTNPEPRRSSSSSRVQNMVKDFENKSKAKDKSSSGVDSTPTQKVDYLVKDLELGNRITRSNNVITGRHHRIRNNVTGPIKPTRYAISNNVPRPPNGRFPNVIHRSNTIESTLKENLDSSDSKDVTYI